MYAHKPAYFISQIIKWSFMKFDICSLTLKLSDRFNFGLYLPTITAAYMKIESNFIN